MNIFKNLAVFALFLVFVFSVAACNSESHDTENHSSDMDESHLYSSDSQLTQFGYEEYQIDKFHEQGDYGQGVKIAILDSGVADTNTDIAPAKSKSFVDEIPDDENGHGTKVAGIIGALNNDKGLLGIAPQSQLYIAKVTDEGGYAKSDNLIPAIEWAIDNNVDIINISVGFKEENSKLTNVIAKATEHGIVVVAAAGNRQSEQRETVIDFPARLQDVISVAHLSTDGSLSEGAILNDNIDVYAPGTNIIGSYFDDKLSYDTGSSFAAAYTTGVVALLLENGTVDKSKASIVEKLNAQFGSGDVMNTMNDTIIMLIIWGVIGLILIGFVFLLAVVVKRKLRFTAKRFHNDSRG
jgi:subtilisin family serine protease